MTSTSKPLRPLTKIETGILRYLADLPRPQEQGVYIQHGRFHRRSYFVVRDHGHIPCRFQRDALFQLRRRNLMYAGQEASYITPLGLFYAQTYRASRATNPNPNP